MACKFFVELQYLFDDLVNFIECFFNLNTLIDEVDRGLGHDQKKVK